jgi:hypothetical protein
MEMNKQLKVATIDRSCLVGLGVEENVLAALLDGGVSKDTDSRSDDNALAHLTGRDSAWKLLSLTREQGLEHYERYGKQLTRRYALAWMCVVFIAVRFFFLSYYSKSNGKIWKNLRGANHLGGKEL